MAFAAVSRRENLEALLRSRHLDRTLVPPEGDRTILKAETGIPELDARLHGGFPRGQLSEVVGPRSSGRTTIVQSTLAAATRRGELTALVDAVDSFDPPSGAMARVDFTRLLWVRGPSIAHTAASGSSSNALFLAATERAVKAFNLILQAGHFGVVILDLADVPAAIIRRLPFTTWLRLQRVLESSEAAGLLIAEEHFGRSARGLTLQLPIDRAVSREPEAPSRRKP